MRPARARLFARRGQTLHRARSYRLTPEIVAASVGVGVLCLSAAGIGRTYRVYPRRPGAELNSRIYSPTLGATRTDLPSGAAHVIEPVVPALVRVDIMGPLEQRAGYHDICGGWSDGHDAVAERLCAAFAEGDVLLCMDSPGGACAGLEQGIARALEAKAKYGRRCTGWINEQMGSAATWWGMSLCDEIFLPSAGQAGSIGARGQHESIAGLLEKEGVVVTYFADPPEKVAFAPELPLSATGAARGNRDASLAASAFRAAVCASPLGLRAGLTPEALIELGADMLTGQAAVDAGLADGVASEGEVIAYALKMAESGATNQKTATRNVARGDRKMKIRAEEEENRDARTEDPEDMPPSDPMPPSSEPGREIPSACAACGVQNEDDAKYCKGCGASMATTAEDPKEPEAAQPPPPKRMSNAAGLAEILGLQEGASIPAQKSAAIDLRQVFDHASRLTGQSDPGAVLGALTAMAEDAAASGRLRRERDKAQRLQNRDERQRLAHQLVASGVPRTDVFHDIVSSDGTRQGVKLAPVYAEMRLSTLRGHAAQKAKNAPRRNPFEPDRDAAAAASNGSKNGGSKETRIKAALEHPHVVEWANRPGQTLSLEQLAKSFVESNFDLPNGASQ